MAHIQPITITKLARTQVARAYRRKLGDYEVTALADGFVDPSSAVWQNLSQEEYNASLARRFIPKFRNGITSHLLNTGAKLYLVDTGAAGLFGPNSFHFPENLPDAGVRAEDIDEVLVTGPRGRVAEGRVPYAPEGAHPTERDRTELLDERVRAGEGARVDARLVGHRAGRGEGVWRPNRNVQDLRCPRRRHHNHRVPGHTPGQTGYLIESAGHASDPKAAAALAFAARVIDTRGHVDDSDLAALRLAGFNDEAAVEIIGNIVQTMFTNLLNNVARTEVDFPSVKPSKRAA